MSPYDSTSPQTSHNALGDVSAIQVNTNALRENEKSLEAAPPSSPTAGQWWYTSDSEKIYQRTNAGGWLYLWSISDPPAKSSDLTTHTGSNITSSVTVHGIRQGSGNGLDADLIDGNHASAFLGTSHGTSTSGIHGVGAGTIVGTTLTQTFTNKTLGAGNSISENITVTALKTIDGRDISVDGAKLDTYPGSGLATPSDGSCTLVKLNNFQPGADWSMCTANNGVSTTLAAMQKKKEASVPSGGKLRIRFDMYHSAGGQQANGRIYRNGAAVGILQSTNSTTAVTFSEDIAGWSPGDLVQLYISTPSGTGTTYAGAFNISASWPKATVILD